MAWGFSRVNVGIDLRKELNILFHGNHDIVEIGQWVILRSYDLTTKSQYYKEETKEGVGGPKWVYTDYLYKTYKWNSWVSDPFTEVQVQPGIMTVPLVTFFFEHNIVKIKEQDEIYEFDWEDHTVTPILESIPKPYDIRYNIKNIQTYRLDQGRKEFYGVKAIKESISY